jgi:plastocyanin
MSRFQLLSITADDGSFTSDNLAPGSTFEANFSTTGDFHYHCNIHPTMTGTVTVTP